MIIVEVPIKTTSTNSKLRVHWRMLRSQTKNERAWVGAFLRKHTPPPLPVFVRMTRCSAGELDSDNLQGALKAVRDEVARWLGVDDASKDVDWVYDQEKTKKKVCGVRIFIEPRAD